ncbi:MAG TPA: hypothetical protein DEQ37_09970 [Clostridiales bacterium]|nr:hypothetical protein [Clostridiales bacterium]HCV69954.1 hypothetical protein [Clostridiales bacterium]
MKQWMRSFFAVLMMLCLLAGCTAWAEKALDGNGLTGLQEREKKPDVSSMVDASMDNKSSAKATFEGGWLGVYDNNHLVTMAVCYIDDSIIAVSSDKLREYAARGTTLALYDFMEEKSYSVRVGKEENSVIRFVLDGAHDIPSLYMSGNVAYGETIGLSGGEMDGTISGFVQKDADGLTIMPEVVAATRPAKGELFGAYSGSALAQGSPIFGSSSDGTVVMLGLADKNHRYLDLNAYYDLAEAAEHPTAAPTAAPTEAPAAESQTQTVLYVIIGVLAAAVVALVLTRGRKKGGKNQQEEAETQRFQQPEEKDAPTQQLPVEEKPQPRVALACIGGALQGMTFPISSRVVFGRDPKRCSIIYPKDAKGISGVHCAAEPTADGQIILTDLGSTYGTMVGGQQLTAGKGVTLHPGDAFTLGGKENVFVVRCL